MNRIIILSLFSTILTGYNLTAQEKHLFLQIDTLEYYDKLETILNFKINIGNQGFLNYGDIVDSNYVLSFNTTPNYTASFSLKNENSIIEIPIDSNGSEIHIYNSYNLKSDTIRINRLSLYETQTNDTTYTIIEHYKVTNGRIFTLKKRAFLFVFHFEKVKCTLLNQNLKSLRSEMRSYQSMR